MQRIIDAHVHWREPDANPYGSLSDGVDADGHRGGRRPDRFLPADYDAAAHGFDIRGFVHVEAEWSRADPVGETRWLEALADGSALSERPLAIVGYADLSDPEVDAVLAAHAAHPRVRGVRHILNRVEGRPDLCWADRDHLADPVWQRNFARLADHGLAFDLMAFAHQLPAIAELAARNPGVPVHLEHAALPHDHTAAGRAAWRSGMRALAARPNASVKISGLGNTVPDWTADSIRAYVRDTIEIFGTDRVAFASNFPTDAAFSDMGAIWNAFLGITADATAEERDAMFHDNALRLYRPA